MPNNQELHLQQTQMLSNQDFRLQQTQCSQTKISGVHKQFHPPNKSITTTRQRGAYLPEHKIEVFVRFWGLEPSFSGLSSTKSGFLCAFGVWNPRYRAFRAQNRHVCALFDFGTPIFRLFEHKSCFHGNQSLMGDGKINRG